MTALVLASASPARLSTLRAAGIDPEVIVSGVDESQVAALPTAELALELARLKAAAVAPGVQGPDVVALRCASVPKLNAKSLGKPGTPRQPSSLCGPPAYPHRVLPTSNSPAHR